MMDDFDQLFVFPLMETNVYSYLLMFAYIVFFHLNLLVYRRELTGEESRN